MIVVRFDRYFIDPVIHTNRALSLAIESRVAEDKKNTRIYRQKHDRNPGDRVDRPHRDGLQS